MFLFNIYRYVEVHLKPFLSGGRQIKTTEQGNTLLPSVIRESLSGKEVRFMILIVKKNQENVYHKAYRKRIFEK